jgi:hypothetical protein
MTDQYHDRQTMERLHQHLARADRGLRDAQHFFDPDSAEGAEMDLEYVSKLHGGARLAAMSSNELVSDELWQIIKPLLPTEFYGSYAILHDGTMLVPVRPSENTSTRTQSREQRTSA